MWSRADIFRRLQIICKRELPSLHDTTKKPSAYCRRDCRHSRQPFYSHHLLSRLGQLVFSHFISGLLCLRRPSYLERDTTKTFESRPCVANLGEATSPLLLQLPSCVSKLINTFKTTLNNVGIWWIRRLRPEHCTTTTADHWLWGLRPTCEYKYKYRYVRLLSFHL